MPARKEKGAPPSLMVPPRTRIVQAFRKGTQRRRMIEVLFTCGDDALTQSTSNTP
jgi:hypothetical protein